MSGILDLYLRMGENSIYELIMAANSKFLLFSFLS